jgi:hypothetical protein
MRFTIFLAACVCLAIPATAQQGPSRQAARPGWPCAGKVDPAYAQITEATGGKLLLFHPAEVEGAALDARASRQHDETVFRGSGQLAGEPHEFTVPIDSTIESAYFFVSVQCLQFVALVTPSGQELAVGPAGAEHHQFESIRLFIVPKPAPGAWRITAAGRGFYSVIVTAQSELSLGDLSFTERGLAEVTLSGSARQAAFHFAGANGAPLQAVQLELEEDASGRRTYRGQVVRPRAAFRLAVSGLDVNGFAFQRMDRRLELR